MKKILLSLLVLLGLGCASAYAQFLPVNCATSIMCTQSGPSNTGTGDPFYVAFGKENTQHQQLYNMFGAGSHLATAGSVLASDIVGLFSGCSGVQYLGADGACHNAGGGGGGVSSVGLTAFAGITVTGSPITTSGSFALSTTLSGLLKGTGAGFSTSLSSDVTTLWTGACSSTTYLRGDGQCQTPPGTGGGTVNSVGLTMPTGFTVTGSPITNTGTLAVTTSLSGMLKGNGTGFVVATAADIVGLFSGCSGTQYLGADGACHTAAGSGTVNSGNGGQLAWYASTGAAVSGTPNASISGPTLTLGDSTTNQGSLILGNGSTGTVQLKPSSSAGTGTITFPNTGGSDTAMLLNASQVITNKSMSIGQLSGVTANTIVGGVSSTAVALTPAQVIGIINSQTCAANVATTYTFVIGDANVCNTTSNAAAQAITVPPNSSVAFPVGTVLNLQQIGAGQATLNPGSGVTLQGAVYGSSTSQGYQLGTAFGFIQIQKIATDTWNVNSWVNPVLEDAPGGTKFTASGSCTNSATAGDATSGDITMSSVGGCTIIVAVNGAVGSTAKTCWMGTMWDVTQPTIPTWGVSSCSTTTATFSVPAAVASADHVKFGRLTWY